MGRSVASAWRRFHRSRPSTSRSMRSLHVAPGVESVPCSIRTITRKSFQSVRSARHRDSERPHLYTVYANCLQRRQRKAIVLNTGRADAAHGVDRYVKTVDQAQLVSGLVYYIVFLFSTTVHEARTRGRRKSAAIRPRITADRSHSIRGRTFSANRSG